LTYILNFDQDCPHCRAFYEAAFAGEDKSKIESTIALCSRHREEYEAPDTPPGYWDTTFPQTQKNLK
jgi:hypothetical protein